VLFQQGFIIESPLKIKINIPTRYYKRLIEDLMTTVNSHFVKNEEN